MKIGLISDSHGETLGIKQAIRILEKLGISTAIHCGDVGADVAPLLDCFKVHFVFGNMDDSECLRREIRSPDHTLHEWLGTLEIEGRKVAFLHGNDVKLLLHTIHSGHWDLVCYGHTHAFSSKLEGKTLVVNPGALSRTERPSIAVIDFPSLDVTKIPL